MYTERVILSEQKLVYLYGEIFLYVLFKNILSEHLTKKHFYKILKIKKNVNSIQNMNTN